MKEKKLFVPKKNHEQVEAVIEKCMGLWKCKICDKTTKLKNDIRRHAEIHIEGMIIPVTFALKRSQQGMD